MSLTRHKGRTTAEICADCSAPNPDWASINRGVLICDECCSVHRSLGRHISQVRHLRLAPWHASLLAMTQNLVSNGANLIWEHSLSDSTPNRGGTRKPNPKDTVHPAKSTFIKAKYQMLAFVHRLPLETTDKFDRSITDLSKQLYSSVRTGNLETSLRLISLGAQPNYFQPEKGNTPLHVAAQAGQATQCELLVCHGADPSALDSNEKTAAILAIESGYQDLGFRLIELMYELTDRLTFYLCGRRPDHKNGINYLIPALQDRGIGESEVAKEARMKLQSLNNRLFEELCSDVYDEVDRRENDAVWLATQHHRKLVSDHTAVPFLPVNPSFTSTRNQGRQKLARFNALEFATLIVDILHDAKRREGLNINNQSSGVVEELKTADRATTGKSVDLEPDYDEVQDDDGQNQQQQQHQTEDDDYDEPMDFQTRMRMEKGANGLNEDGKPEGKVHDLQEQNHSLGQEVNLLRSMVQKLMQENAALRAQVAQVVLERDELEQRYENDRGNVQSTYDKPRKTQPNLQLLNDTTKSEAYDVPTKSHVSIASSMSDSILDGSSLRSRSETNYDNVPDGMEPPEDSEDSAAYQTGDDVEFPMEIGPSQDDIVNATEQITKKIQELLQNAQVADSSKKKVLHKTLTSKIRYVKCSSNISAAVNDMANLFPKHPAAESVRMALRLMITSAARLQVECRSSSLDEAMLTQQVIQCAYDIAKAAKQLVTTYNSTLS